MLVTNCLQDWVPRGWKEPLNILFAKDGAEGASWAGSRGGGLIAKPKWAPASFLEQRPRKSPRLVGEKYNRPRKHQQALESEPWITE